MLELLLLDPPKGTDTAPTEIHRANVAVWAAGEELPDPAALVLDTLAELARLLDAAPVLVANESGRLSLEEVWSAFVQAHRTDVAFVLDVESLLNTGSALIALAAGLPHDT